MRYIYRNYGLIKKLSAQIVLERRARITQTGAFRLEYKRKVVTDKFSSFEGFSGFTAVVPCRCKSFMCPKCRARRGCAVRESLLKSDFKIPILFTITINRKNFSSPKDAYLYVQRGRFLARLLTKELKIRKWVAVLEFQEASGEGWPHWHILADVSDLPFQVYKGKRIPHFFDLDKAHRLLSKWKIGNCDLQKGIRFFDSRHAVMYITKYLTKPPKRGYPRWALETNNLYFCRASRALGSLSGSVRRKRSSSSESDCNFQKRHHAPVDRISSCQYEYRLLCFSDLYRRFFIGNTFFASPELVQQFFTEKEIFFSKRDFRPYFLRGFSDVSSFEQYLSLLSDNDRQFHDIIARRKQFLLSQWETTNAA